MSTMNSQTTKTSQSPKKSKVLDSKAGLKQSDMESFQVEETCSEAEDYEISKETEKALKQAAKTVANEVKNEVCLSARERYKSSINQMKESFGGKAWKDGPDHSDAEEGEDDNMEDGPEDHDEEEGEENELEDDDDIDLKEEIENGLKNDGKSVGIKKKNVIKDKNEKDKDGSKKMGVKNEMVDEEGEEMKKRKKERKFEENKKEEKESKKRKMEVEEKKEMKKKEGKKEDKKEDKKDKKKKNDKLSSKEKDVLSLHDKISVLDKINEIGMQLGACCKNTVLSQKNREKMEEILNDYAELMLNSENVEIPRKICDLMKECYDFASSRSEMRYLNSQNFKQAAKLFNDLLSDKIALFEEALEKNSGI